MSRHNARTEGFCRESLAVLLRDLPRARCLAPHKIKFMSRKGADSAAERQWKCDGRVLHVYACSDHFHLTSRGLV